MLAYCLPLAPPSQSTGLPNDLNYGRDLLQIDAAFDCSAPLRECPPPPLRSLNDQIDAAFDYLLRSETVDALGIRYELSVSTSGGGVSSPSGTKTPRGIYMRQAHESRAPVSYTVTVTPVLHADAPNLDRLAVEDRLVLEPGADWVTCPSSLLLHHSGRGFEVCVSVPPAQASLIGL